MGYNAIIFSSVCLARIHNAISTAEKTFFSTFFVVELGRCLNRADVFITKFFLSLSFHFASHTTRNPFKQNFTREMKSKGKKFLPQFRHKMLQPRKKRVPTKEKVFLKDSFPKLQTCNPNDWLLKIMEFSMQTIFLSLSLSLSHTHTHTQTHFSLHFATCFCSTLVQSQLQLFLSNAELLREFD